MTVGVLSACHKLRGKVVRGALERCVFAAIGHSLAATSIGALGAARWRPRRSEFAAILRTNGVDGLIAALNRKTDMLTETMAKAF